MSARKALARDVVASLARHVATALVGFVTIPILARVLGAKGLGFWSLLGTSAFLLSLADLGLNAATLRAAAGSDASLAKRAARHAARGTFALAIPGAIACAAWLASVARDLPDEQRAHALAAIGVALAAGVLNAVAQSARSYAHGRGRLVALARARATGAIVQLGVTIAALVPLRDLLAVAIGYAAGVVAESWLSVRAARDDVSADAPLTREERRELSVASRSAFVTNVAVIVAVRTDVVVLQSVTDLETIAVYSVASRLVDQAYTFVKQISAALAPRLGARARDPEGLLSAGTMVIGALAAAPLAVLAVAGRPIIVLWAGPALDKPILGVAAAWLAIAAIVAASEEVASSRLALGGDPRLAARAILAGSAVNVAFSLAGAAFVGTAAVAAATLLGTVVASIVLWRATRATLGWPLARVVAALAPAVIAGGAGALAAALLRTTSLHAIATAVLSIAIGGAAAFVAMRRTLRGVAQELA